MPLSLRRRGGQQIRVMDRASGRILWIEVYQRSPHSHDLDFCFRDKDQHFDIQREERLAPEDRDEPVAGEKPAGVLGRGIIRRRQ